MHNTPHLFYSSKLQARPHSQHEAFPTLPRTATSALSSSPRLGERGGPLPTAVSVRTACPPHAPLTTPPGAASRPSPGSRSKGLLSAPFPPAPHATTRGLSPRHAVCGTGSPSSAPGPPRRGARPRVGPRRPPAPPHRPPTWPDAAATRQGAARAWRGGAGRVQGAGLRRAEGRLRPLAAAVGRCLASGRGAVNFQSAAGRRGLRGL